MNSPNFWDNKEQADKTVKEISYLKNIIDPIKEIEKKIINNLEVIEDSELIELLETEYGELYSKLETLKLETYFSGKYDRNNCLLEIHAGAGGTEACDWANMLYRMYQRYCKKNDFLLEEIDSQAGEEVGLKSVICMIKGINAFGYFKNEKGIHRLVRISPFDANKRRHTSFASVDVIPEVDKSINIQVQDSDLRIDIYRSSGPGGQGVNTTDSAVRLTHIPTGIVVTCQNERSQIQNKERALEILKSKLMMIEIEKQQQELSSMKQTSSIGFGYNKRSYVLCPYTLVKDIDTGYETSNVNAVLDGEIGGFILEGLKRGKNDI